jgi:hypothetical protein
MAMIRMAFLGLVITAAPMRGAYAQNKTVYGAGTIPCGEW